MIFYVDAIGALLLLGGACALAACWLIDRHHERTPLFAGGYGPEPEPREAAPLLPEMIAAPVAAPPALPDYVTDAMGHGGDSEAAVASMWDRIQVDALNEKLREDAS